MREKHRIFKCDTCNFTSSSDVGLKIHKTKSHIKIDLEDTNEERLIECGQCDLIFKNRNDLCLHIHNTECFWKYCASKQGLPQFMKL